MKHDDARKILRSRGGLKITIDDTADRERFVIETSGGQKFLLQNGPGQIEVRRRRLGLFVSQGNQRIDAGRAAGRKVARRHASEHDDRNHRDQRPRIARRNPPKLVRHYARQPEA